MLKDENRYVFITEDHAELERYFGLTVRGAIKAFRAADSYHPRSGDVIFFDSMGRQEVYCKIEAMSLGTHLNNIKADAEGAK